MHELTGVTEIFVVKGLNYEEDTRATMRDQGTPITTAGFARLREIH